MVRAASSGSARGLFYLSEGLVLAHYDAKAHLVVARRVIDSLTPGWRQIGAVWLPLPHLIQILPTQIDVFYRTGAFASLLSIACFGVAAWATSRLVLLITGSRLGAVDVGGAPRAQPESALPARHADDRAAAARGDAGRRCSGCTSGCVARPPTACRHELGWALFADGVDAIRGVADRRRGACRRGVRAVAARRRRRQCRSADRGSWRCGRRPLCVLFLVLSRITVGAWFVSGGFYERDPTYDAQAGKTLLAIWWGTHRLSGYVDRDRGADGCWQSLLARR